MKDINTREDYSFEEIEEKESYIQCRNDLVNDYKMWATDIWMKVIRRAIEDAALCKTNRDHGIKLTEEEEQWEISALGFLFDPSWVVPFDDYFVDITCPKCQSIWSNLMSVVAAENSVCPKCKNSINPKYVTYNITEEQGIREIDLRELLSLWGVYNMEKFRNGCRHEIEILSKRKIPKQRKEKCQKKQLELTGI